MHVILQSLERVVIKNVLHFRTFEIPLWNLNSLKLVSDGIDERDNEISKIMDQLSIYTEVESNRNVFLRIKSHQKSLFEIIMKVSNTTSLALPMKT